MHTIDRVIYLVLSAMSLGLIFTIAVSVAKGDTENPYQVEENSTEPHRIEIHAAALDEMPEGLN